MAAANGAAIPLLPVQPPIFNDEIFVRNEVTRLQVDNVGRLSGDNFLVHDQTGRVIISATGPQFSSLAEKKIYDGNGAHMYDLKSDIISLKHGMTCTRGGQKIFKIGYHKALLATGDNKFEVTWYDDTTTKHQLAVTGDWNSFKGQIILEPQNAVIATLEGHAAPQVGFEQHQNKMGSLSSEEKVTTVYYVNVAPGVDVGVMSVICMCCDIIHKSSSK